MFLFYMRLPFLYVFAILLSLFLYISRSVFYMYDYMPIVSIGPSVYALPSLSYALLYVVLFHSVPLVNLSFFGDTTLIFNPFF